MPTLDENRIIEIATEKAFDIAYKMTMSDRDRDSRQGEALRIQLATLTATVDSGFKDLNEKLGDVKIKTKENSDSIKSLEETRSEQKGSLRIGSYLVNAAVALGTAFLTALWTTKK